MEMKPIKDYEDFYAISENGKVWSYRKNRFLKEIIGDGGYLQVNLFKNGSFKYFRIHRLVAEHFIKKIPSGLTVDHIDGNKKNNSVNNLQIISRGENSYKANKGRKLSLATKNKISNSKKGHPSNRKGVTLSTETKKKMSEAHKNRFKNLCQELNY